MLHFTVRASTRLAVLASLLTSSLALVGCPSSTTPASDAGGLDAAITPDAHGTPDGAIDDAGRDAASAPDTGTDAARPDGGSDAAARDAAPSSDWAACELSTECVLEANDCCGWCGAGGFGDVDAVNRERSDAHAMEVCPTPTPCPACLQGPLDPQVVAVCEARACRAVDLGTLPVTECSDASECIVAYGNCCGCSGGDDDVIAIRADAGREAIDALFCGGACAADCVAVDPFGWGASCEDHRCVPVRIAP